MIATTAGWKISVCWQLSVKDKSKEKKKKKGRENLCFFCTFPQDVTPLLNETVNTSGTVEGAQLI